MAVKPGLKCTATNKAGHRCGSNPIRGATVCWKHGGAAPQVKALAAVRLEVSRWQIGDQTEDPGDVLQRLVTQSYRRVELVSAEMERRLTESKSLSDLLVGDAMGEFGKIGEYLTGLAIYEAQERERAANFAAKAVAAGLGERQVRLAERQGELLATVLRAIMQDPRLGLSESQQAVFIPVMREQMAIAAK